MLFRLPEYCNVAVGRFDCVLCLGQSLFVVFVKYILTACFLVSDHAGGFCVLIDSCDPASFAAVIQSCLKNQIQFIADLFCVDREQCFNTAAQVAPT